MINTLLIMAVFLTPLLLMALITVTIFLLEAIKSISLVEQVVESELPITPFITKSAPEFTNEPITGQNDSVIVVPKSPQRIEWEEQEELRKMNLGRPR